MSKYKGADSHIFTTKYYPLSFVVENTIIPEPSECPRAIVIAGSGRSCTTGLLAWLMSNPKVQLGYYQPWKTIVRHGLQYGQLIIPGLAQRVSLIVMKETWGPFDRKHEEFDPIKLLVQAGVPLAKIILIPIMREPLATFKSNFKFEGGISSEMLISNLKFTWKLYQRYKSQILVIPLASDLIGQRAEVVGQSLCRLLKLPDHGLNFDQQALQPIKLTHDYVYHPDQGKFIPGEATHPAEWEEIVKPTFSRDRLEYRPEVVKVEDFRAELRKGALEVETECGELYKRFLEFSERILRK